jgi:hypothetical protein
MISLDQLQSCLNFNRKIGSFATCVCRSFPILCCRIWGVLVTADFLFRQEHALAHFSSSISQFGFATLVFVLLPKFLFFPVFWIHHPEAHLSLPYSFRFSCLMPHWFGSHQLTRIALGPSLCERSRPRPAPSRPDCLARSASQICV